MITPKPIATRYLPGKGSNFTAIGYHKIPAASLCSATPKPPQARRAASGASSRIAAVRGACRQARLGSHFYPGKNGVNNTRVKILGLEGCALESITSAADPESRHNLAQIA